MRQAEMSDYINYIHDLASEGRFSDIDHYLIELTAVPSKESYVLALRASFAFKDKLKNWSIIRDAAIRFLESQNIEPKTLLHGLLDYDIPN